MSDLYTKETLTQALEWLSARKDVVTGVDIDRYVAQLPTVAHGVLMGEALQALDEAIEILSQDCADSDAACRRVRRARSAFLTSHRAPSDGGVREAAENALKMLTPSSGFGMDTHEARKYLLQALAALTKEKS